ncbi:hypothetical protein [Helicobacter macacae]|uniref:Plasminogen-binding protein pgbB n=1 Tax=Helicobacter macacae MIT 99-5501 TaxID=1357400 RepID=V8C5Y0_9HELI|nr:hypothetical protein [Helicobacter macacae]ETD22823.1 hypothetical protein HMPREF2086_01622 [Helicobacter macacae MIT 99-5501]
MNQNRTKFIDIARIFTLAFISCVVFLGCSSKKFYTPAKVDGEIIFSQSLPTPIAQNNRYVATLKDGSLLTQSGFVPINKQIKEIIPKDARFLNESGGYYIFAKGCDEMLLVRASVIDESAFDSGTCPIKEENSACTKEQIKLKTQGCAISASLKGNLLAFVTTDNTSHIISLESSTDFANVDFAKDESADKDFKNSGENSESYKSVFSQKGSAVLAVNQLIAAPLFLDSVVVFPTLDGRILVVSLQNYETQRNIIVSSEKFFNNIIYLQGDDVRIFAATPKKLISIVSGQQFSYQEDIKDITFANGYLYALTLEGKIAQLDHTLREVNTRKFEYASLEGMSVANNVLYTYEKNGSFIIALDLENFSHKVYQAQDTFGKMMSNKLHFYTKNIFYYNRYYFDFAKIADFITSQ